MRLTVASSICQIDSVLFTHTALDDADVTSHYLGTREFPCNVSISSGRLWRRLQETGWRPRSIVPCCSLSRAPRTGRLGWLVSSLTYERLYL